MVNKDFHRPTIALKAVDSFLISVTQFSIRVRVFVTYCYFSVL